MVYITIAKASGIVQQIDPERLKGLTGELYKRAIYMFSRNETIRLLAIKELFKDAEYFINTYYIPMEVEDSTDVVFDNKPPAYHLSKTCQWLLSDYTNIKVPSVISKKGEEEVLAFKQWVQENVVLYRTERESFYSQLSVNFNIPKTEIEEVTFPNSGPTIFENLNLEQIEEQIDKLLSDAQVYYNQTPKHKAILSKFQCYTYLAYRNDPILKNDTEYGDEEIKSILKDYDEQFKKRLKRLLVEYYKIQYNPELEFQGHLLERLGFHLCKSCEYNSGGQS